MADVVSGEQYRYALTNFRIAHEKVEEQRVQLQEQEKQVALLRARIALLEGINENGLSLASRQNGGSTVDDFSIKNAASNLERAINRWAADLIRTPPAPLDTIRAATLSDIFAGTPPDVISSAPHATGMQVQNLLRHSMSQTISESIINCLIITDSAGANIQITRIHEQIFARNPTVAAVWRRQTFSAAVEACSPEMSTFFFDEHMPALMKLLPANARTATSAVLEAGYAFSRMLHGLPSSVGSPDAFYRAFVPDLGSTMHPHQIELVKRCMRTEKGNTDRVGATVFPGLVKVHRRTAGEFSEQSHTIMRRAQVICGCAMGMSISVESPGA